MIESHECFLCQEEYINGIAVSYRFVCIFCMNAIWLSNTNGKDEGEWPSIEEWRNILELDSFHYQVFGLPAGGGGSNINKKVNISFTAPLKGVVHYLMNSTHQGEWVQKEVFLNKNGETDTNSV